MKAGQTVAILGASAAAERYAFKAQRLLKQCGHRVLPINSKLKEIDGDTTLPSLKAIAEPVDTLTVYVRPALSSAMAADILALAPRRVIFNPGAENPQLETTLRQAGIASEDACTMVLLRTHQF